MRFLRRFLTRLANFVTRRRNDERLKEEIEEHLAQQTAENLRAGLSPAEARRQAMLKFGGVEAIKEDYRAERGMLFVETLLQDIRYGLRMLRKSPGFTAVAVLTLALGIGANTAIFSLIDAVMLRSLPVRNPQQLYLFEWRAQGWPQGDYSSHDDCPYDLFGSKPAIGCSFPLLTVNAFRAKTNAFSGLAAFSTPKLQATVDGRVVASRAAVVSGDYFSTLGVKAALGRTIEPSDDQPGAAPVAVLSYAFWESTFGGKRSEIGRTIFLNQVACTIVGVAEASFTNLSPGKTQDLWVPIAMMPQLQAVSGSSIYDGMGNWWLAALTRLKPGVSPQQAQAAASVIFENELRGSGNPQARMTNPGILLTPAAEGLTGMSGHYSQPLYILMFAAGMILLIACANVAGLLVSRGEARQKEIALRLAIGAGRGRIMRQLLTESLLLSGAGGVAGTAFAYEIVRAVTPLVSLNSGGRFPFVVGPDWRVLGFALGVTIASGIFFGFVPALAGRRLDLISALKENAPTHPGGAPRLGWLSLGNLLVVAQVALGAVVLCGAGLLVHTLENLRAINPGFDPQNVLLFRLDPSGLNYTSAHLETVYERLRERLASLPGVQSVSYSYVPLLTGDYNGTSADIKGEAKESQVRVDELPIGPEFLRTMRISLLEGRGFDSEDFRLALEKHQAGQPDEPAAKGESKAGTAQIRDLARIRMPVLVNEAFVHQYVRGVDPVDEQIGVGCCDAQLAQIVGVVGDTKYGSLRLSIHPTIYLPYTGGAGSFEVRTMRDPLTLASTLRQIIKSIAPDLPISDIRTQAEAIDQILWQERLLARFSSYSAALAMLLASIGLYGLLAYEVARRRREIGIRMALGAQKNDVLKMVGRQGLRLAMIGVAVGLVGALALTRFLSSLLYGVKPNDPGTFIAVTLLLVGVALIACYIPAHRAMRVDPMVALRYE
ncbi:MAG: ABC transporter permease [Candidatus Acidiferrales bacterium]